MHVIAVLCVCWLKIYFVVWKAAHLSRNSAPAKRGSGLTTYPSTRVVMQWRWAVTLSSGRTDTSVCGTVTAHQWGDGTSSVWRLQWIDRITVTFPVVCDWWLCLDCWKGALKQPDNGFCKSHLASFSGRNWLAVTVSSNQVLEEGNVRHWVLSYQWKNDVSIAVTESVTFGEQIGSVCTRALNSRDFVFEVWIERYSRCLGQFFWKQGDFQVLYHEQITRVRFSKEIYIEHLKCRVG